MPWSRILAFDDLDAYMSAIRAAQVEITPISRGAFRAELMQANLHRLWLQRGHENLPTISRNAIVKQRAVIGFLADIDQPSVWHCGTELRPGEILVTDWNATHRRTVAPSRWASMSLSPEDFVAAGRALTGRDLPLSSEWGIVRPKRPLMVRLMRLHARADRIARAAPERLAHPQVARALEQSLVHALFMCLTESTQVEISRGTRHHAAIVEKFENILEANPAGPLYLADICAATGVSERTLRVCCHERYGMGPMRYLWLRRMHLARRALVSALPDTSTVTEIATGQGFWELGRFSIEYRALFGESPSTSLRRPAEIWQTAQVQ